VQDFHRSNERFAGFNLELVHKVTLPVNPRISSMYQRQLFLGCLQLLGIPQMNIYIADIAD